MPDIFEQKSAHPMLIKSMVKPFDNPDYIYELKLDGERCIAYLDTEKTILLNKRNFILVPRFPELSELHKTAKCKCILDGEIVALKDGQPYFEEIRRRSALTNGFKLKLSAQNYQICFTAFDILYFDGKQITDLPLTERKEFLNKAIRENGKLAISRFIEKNGTSLYNLTVKQNLEGVVAKRKDSIYRMGKETTDWVKIKNLKDDDFVICGYVDTGGYTVSIILGQSNNKRMVYKGHVPLSKSSSEFDVVSKIPKINTPPFPAEGNETFVKPELVCVVKYMQLTANGMLRQPVFKALRDDKKPEECIEGKN